jgi:hypothetical protein
MVINKTKFTTPLQHQGLHTTTSHGPLIHHVVPHNGSRIDVLSQPRGSFHMDKMILFFSNIDSFYKFKIIIFHDLLCYFHMRSEIIQIVNCDNCDGFQHLSFIFS